VCCSGALRVPAAAHLERSSFAVIVGTGVAAAFAGLIGFASAHALVIVPIWTQLLGGAPLALLAGIALVGAFDRVACLKGRHSLADGARFGALMFTTLLPPAALAATLRVGGVQAGESNVMAVAALLLALLAGSCAGWLLSHRQDGAMACGAASVALLLVSAGPLPVAQSLRGFWLSIVLAPVCVAAGAVLALVRAVLANRVEQ
jgi:hypothetical protein